MKKVVSIIIGTVCSAACSILITRYIETRKARKIREGLLEDIKKYNSDLEKLEERNYTLSDEEFGKMIDDFIEDVKNNRIDFQKIEKELTN